MCAPSTAAFREGQPLLEALLPRGYDVPRDDDAVGDEDVRLHTTLHARIVEDVIGIPLRLAPGVVAEREPLTLLQLQIVAPLGGQILRQLQVQRLNRLGRNLPAEAREIG